MSSPTPETVARILDAPVDPYDHGCTTVRDYLVTLLARLWTDDADGQYGMTGSSDWRYDLYRPMRDLGIIPPWREGYSVGYPADGGPYRQQRADDADALVVAAIRSLGQVQ